MKYVTEKSNKSFWGQIGLGLLFMALYGAGMTFGLFHISIGNQDMTFIVNMAFISAVTVIVFPAVFKGWDFGLHRKGIVSGIVKYGAGMLVGVIIIVAGICYTAMPFDKTPGIRSVVLECIVFFLLVGLIEELLLRGCIFKALLLKLGDNKKGVILSVLISSVMFSSKDTDSLTADSALLSSVIMMLVTLWLCRKKIAHLIKKTGRED